MRKTNKTILIIALVILAVLLGIEILQSTWQTWPVMILVGGVGLIVSAVFSYRRIKGDEDEDKELVDDREE